MFFFIFLIILFCCLLLYIKIAGYYNIIDKPNTRSSHKYITIRGGGIVFPLAIIFYTVYAGLEYPYFVAGLVVISAVSLCDDLYSVGSWIRLGMHLGAVSLLFFQVDFFYFPLWIVLTSFIFIVGIINAYNFMDGINGITILYSLSILGSLYYLNRFSIYFMEDEYFLVTLASLIVFGFFNVRKRAKAFAGDIGSVSMAFILSFMVITLMLKDANAKWILLFGVYGLDSVATITLRIIRKENVFQAHRSHFYQFLANECKLPHVLVALFYSSIQLIFNWIIITQNGQVIMISYLFLIVVYCTLRFKLEGFKRLFRTYSQ